MTAHAHGLDVLGDGIDVGTFVPWLGVLSGALGGGKDKSKDADAAVKAALAKQKAEADAAKTRTLAYVTIGVIGAVGLVGMVLILKK